MLLNVKALFTSLINYHRLPSKPTKMNESLHKYSS